jgi:hypothetical protein
VNRRRPVARALAAALVLAVTGACGASAPSSSRAHPRRASTANPYFAAPFTVTTNPVTFGQDPTWTADGRVLSNELDPGGTKQVYVSRLDGSAAKCLTCGEPGPNAFPQERPQGDWILFCSWRGQRVTFGSPCLGGFGTDLYVMRPDGSRVTRLTAPGGAVERDTVPYDNYHPYWSPDGAHLAWTHLDFTDRAAGGTQWTILLADFVPGPGAPRLANIRVVAPGGNHAYETQEWAPDGSGLLYTSFTSAGDPRAGWLNTELWFLRLFGDGASPAHPIATHLTDDNAGWDEQAVFTPDMANVVLMSSRAAPTWYETVVTAAQQTGYAPPLENHVAGAMFVLTILDPHFRTDLYELRLSDHAIRRLTSLDTVIPEFTFDRTGARLLWSDGMGAKTTHIGRFELDGAPPSRGRRPPTNRAWIGAPRTGPHAQTVALPPPPPPAARPALVASAIPPSVADGLVLLETQLATLGSRLSGLAAGPSCCRASS